MLALLPFGTYDIVSFITFATYTVNAFNVVMSLLHVKFPILVFDMGMISHHVHIMYILYHVHIHIIYITRFPLWLSKEPA